MKPGRVIGSVVLSERASPFRGARWLLISPMGADELTGRSEYGSAPTPVVYDDLGAGVGDVVLYVEGAEATRSFPVPIPLDAIVVALLETYHFEPPSDS